MAQHREREAEKLVKRARSRDAHDAVRPDRAGTEVQARAQARVRGEAPPAAAVIRAEEVLARERRGVAAAEARLAVCDDAALAAGVTAAAAVAAHREAPQSSAAQQAVRSAADFLAASERAQEEAADALETADVYVEGLLDEDEDEDDWGEAALPPPSRSSTPPPPPILLPDWAATPPPPPIPAPPCASTPSSPPIPPSQVGQREEPPLNNLHGVHLFGGTGSPALALFCICTIALFYVDISNASQALLRLAMAAGLIPSGDIWPDIRSFFDSREFQVKVARVRAAGGALLFTAGWPCQASCCFVFLLN